MSDLNQCGKSMCGMRQELLRLLAADSDISEISKIFGALHSNLERVNYTCELFEKCNLQMEFKEDRKCDERAVQLKEKGNAMFKIRKLKEAWQFYTNSIKQAETNGVNLSIAYANRSAVLFELNLPQQCITDIGRALANNYPDHLKVKLFERKKKCEALESIIEEPYEAIPKIDEKNSQISCAANCIEVKESRNLGRHVIATRDIKPGEILAVERPFVLVSVNQTLNHCHECISLCYNLIPCQNCTHVMYCGEICRDEAWKSYHQYECPILETCKALELDKLKMLPLKIALIVKDNLSDYIKDTKYRSDRYKEIHNLVANTEMRSISDLFERSVAASIIFNLVKNHTNFFNSQKSENTFKELLLLHMQTGPCNFHEITELTPKMNGTYEPEEIASGAYSFLSLLNHSCSPNVTRFCYGSTLVLRAIQSIKKGEQCFDNYGYHYALTRKQDRQKVLRSQYYFVCSCVACKDDWPLYENLNHLDNYASIDENVVKKLATADPEAANRVLEDNLDRLRELEQFIPCRNFSEMQEVVKQCYAIFGNKRRL